MVRKFTPSPRSSMILISCLLAAGCSSGSGDGLDSNGAPLAEESAAVTEPAAAPEENAAATEPAAAPDESATVTEPAAAPEESATVAEPVAAPEESATVAEPVAAPEESVAVTEPVAAPVVPTFRQIQDSIFTPTCSECHGPVGPSAGLMLNEGAAFGATVGVASSEVPSLMRIAPGDPDNSYLVQKIEGTAAVGGRMPLGGPPLSDELIQLVRQWVSDGALPESTEAAAFAPRVVSVSSLDSNAAITRLPNDLTVVWSSAIDNTSLTNDTVSLVRSGGDNSFDEGNEEIIKVAVTSSAEDNDYVTRLVPVNATSVDDTYRLSISGEGDIYAVSAGAQAIDGDSDGTSGGTFTREFTVDSAANSATSSAQ